MAKALYDFAGSRENELSITAGETIEIVQKENNGKLLLLPTTTSWHSTNRMYRMVARQELKRTGLGTSGVRGRASIGAASPASYEIQTSASSTASKATSGCRT
jgi:myosin-1